MSQCQYHLQFVDAVFLIMQLSSVVFSLTCLARLTARCLPIMRICRRLSYKSGRSGTTSKLTTTLQDGTWLHLDYKPVPCPIETIPKPKVVTGWLLRKSFKRKITHTSSGKVVL